MRGDVKWPRYVFIELNITIVMLKANKLGGG